MVRRSMSLSLVSIHICNIIRINCPLLHSFVTLSWRVMEFELYYLIFFFLGERKKSCMGDCLEWPLFNAWTHGATPLAPLLDKSIASSSVHIYIYIYIYIYICISHFLPFHSCWSSERTHHFKDFTQAIMLSLLLLGPSLFTKKSALLCKSLLLLLPLIFYFYLSWMWNFLRPST